MIDIEQNSSQFVSWLSKVVIIFHVTLWRNPWPAPDVHNTQKTCLLFNHIKLDIETHFSLLSLVNMFLFPELFYGMY